MRKLLAVLSIVLLFLFFAPLLIGLVTGSEIGQVSIPTLVTEYWGALVTALLVSLLGVALSLVLRDRERNSLLTMISCDVAQVADRVVTYRVQHHAVVLSKSKIEHAFYPKAQIRLLELVDNDALTEDMVEFYEKLGRAIPCFERASEKAVLMEEAGFIHQDTCVTYVGDAGHSLDEETKKLINAKQKELVLNFAAYKTAARAAQGTGLAFCGKPGKSGDEHEPLIERTAQRILTACRALLGRNEEWYPQRRMNEAIEHLDMLAKVIRAGPLPGRNKYDTTEFRSLAEFCTRWQEYLSRAGVLSDPWWERTMDVPEECRGKQRNDGHA